jgi:hypothetical protein
LRHVGAKLSKEFVADWIMDPTAFRPSTAMPRVIRAGDPQARMEVVAITEYLFRNASPMAESAVAPNADESAAYERGKLLFLGHGLDDAAAAARNLPPGLKAGLGCVACHTNLNDWNNEEQVPWIVVDLQKRENLSRLEAERRYAAMSYNERDAYAMMMQQPALVHFGPELSAIGEQITVADRMAEGSEAVSRDDADAESTADGWGGVGPGGVSDGADARQGGSGFARKRGESGGVGVAADSGSQGFGYVGQHWGVSGGNEDNRTGGPGSETDRALRLHELP